MRYHTWYISYYQVLLLCIGIYNQDEMQSSLDNVIIEIHIAKEKTVQYINTVYQHNGNASSVIVIGL